MYNQVDCSAMLPSFACKSRLALVCAVVSWSTAEQQKAHIKMQQHHFSANFHTCHVDALLFAVAWLPRGCEATQCWAAPLWWCSLRALPERVPGGRKHAGVPVRCVAACYAFDWSRAALRCQVYATGQCTCVSMCNKVCLRWAELSTFWLPANPVCATLQSRSCCGT